MPPEVICTWPFGIELWITGAADHLAVEDDREVLADVVCRVVGEELLALVVEREVDRALAGLVRADAGGRDRVAGEQRRDHGEVQRLAPRPRRSCRAARSPAGRWCRRACGSGRRSVTPGHLDDDPVGALRHDLGLGDAGLVDAVDDDPSAGRRGRRAGRGACPPPGSTRYSIRRPPWRSRPSLVDCGTVPPARGRDRGCGAKSRSEGDQPDDDDQDRSESTHRGGMIQGTARPRRRPFRRPIRRPSPGGRRSRQPAGRGPRGARTAPELGPRKCVNRKALASSRTPRPASTSAR